MNKRDDFYVYALYDPDETFPFYIGKGTGDRAKQSTNILKCGKNTEKINKINSIIDKGKSVKIEFIKLDLTEEESLYLEEKIVEKYRDKLKLTNKASGGLLSSGWKHSDKAKELFRRQKLGKNNPNYGKKMSNEEKEHLRKIFSGEGNPNYGKSMSEEQKLKISNSIKNLPDKIKNGIMNAPNKRMSEKKHSDETRLKMSKSARKRKVKFNNIIFDSIKEVSEFTGIQRDVFVYRCKSNNFLEYSFV